MQSITFLEFEKAVETLGLISLTSKDGVREQYLKLSKKYHPDMENGDKEMFQEINTAYEILSTYIDNYRFVLDYNEFARQFPFSVKPSNDMWS